MTDKPRTGEPIAWTAIPPNTPLFDDQDNLAGTVVEVLGNREEDIFHGLVVAIGGQRRVLTADAVTAISTTGVATDHGAAELAELPLYEAEKTYHVGRSGGLLGRFRKPFVEDEEGR